MVLELWLVIVISMLVKGQDSSTGIRGKKNGLPVRESPVVAVDENFGKISFTGIQDRDYGKYQCFAKNDYGIAFSSVLDLKKAYIQQFSNVEQKDIGKVGQYSYKKIECKFKGPCEPTQDCKFEWKRGLGTAASISETDRIAVDREGTIHFLYVELKDAATYADPIACGQTLESAKAFYKGGPIIMSIVPKSTVPQSQSRARYSADVTGLLSGQATLQCIFSGYPVPAITWKRTNGPRITGNTKYSFESYDRKLVIKNLQEDDEGEYICEAHNSAGRGGATLLLNVTSKPIFRDGAPESLVVPNGENAVFTCGMSSLKNERQPTAPKWYRNGEELPASQIGSSDSQKYKLSADKTELTVKHVRNPADTCSFMCIAGNVIADDNGRHRFMETYAGATLIVIEPIEVTVLSKTSIELITTAPCSLAVSATTDKTIKSLMYEWTFTRPDNTTVYSNAALKGAQWVVFNGMGNLTIVPENVTADRDYDKVREVTGTYQVHIYHTYESKYVQFVVYTNLQPEERIKVTILSKTSIELITTAPCSLAVSATTDRTIKSLMYEWTFTRPDDTTVYSNAALKGAPWVVFNGMGNLTIVPENVTADRDYDKVREVTGTSQVHIYHTYESKYVKFVVYTNLQQEERIKVTILSKTSIELITTDPCSLAVSATTDRTIKSLMYEWTFTRPDDTTVYSNAALKGAPWVVFNGMGNLTIVPENVTADRDYDKVREVTGTYQVHIFHTYESKYVKFVVYTNLQQEERIKVTILSKTSIELITTAPCSLAVSATIDRTIKSLMYEWTFTRPDDTTVYSNAALKGAPWVVFNGMGNLTIVPENVTADRDYDKVREVTGTYQVHIYHTYESKYVKFVVFTNLQPEERIEVTILSNTSIELITTAPFSLAVSATTDKTIKSLMYEWTFTRPDDTTVYGNAALKGAPWVVFNEIGNLTIVPENVIADRDYDKVREVTGTYQVHIYHKYQSKYVKFVVFTSCNQKSR